MFGGTRQVFNLEQVYRQIGDRYCEIEVALHLPLLDPFSCLEDEAAFRLGLVTTFQYAEGLDDLAAAQATSDRRDWRYALHLSAGQPGLSAPLLCRFRASLYFSPQALHELEQMLTCLRKMGLFSAQADVQEAEKVVSRVCSINHFMQLKQSMKTALSSLAACDPQWLGANALPHWYERYRAGRLDRPNELSDLEMQEAAVRLGRDIRYLLKMLNEPGLSILADQAELKALAKLLESEFVVSDEQMSWWSPSLTTDPCSGPRLCRIKFNSWRWPDKEEA